MGNILNAKEIEQTISDCADWIVNLGNLAENLAIIGIRSRGVILAQRLVKRLQSHLNHDIPYGVVDITLYRDDLDDPRGNQQPMVQSTEIDFDLKDKTVILVDDVLYTGRTIRAAMGAIFEFGRPDKLKLAVMIDRGGRELPIQPDFAGKKIQLPNNQKVIVNFTETDKVDKVFIE